MRKINAYKIAKLFVSTGFFLAIGILSAKAQEPTTLKGNITELKSKNPVIGANIHIDGSTNTVTTDNKGNFQLSTYKKLPVTLYVSFVGYVTQLVTVDSSNIESIVVQLKEAPANQLSDVVVIGYGTQRRSDVTGSVVGVQKANLNQPVSSPENLLQGAVAGVNVTQSSGAPGASSTVKIRGGNSVLGGNEPLYVIDGYPVYNNNAEGNPGGTYSGASLNVLSTINPNDIESIDVLKDAAATAIYGTRGANGVVLITTKKGTKGTTNVSYAGYVGVQEVAKKISLLNGGQWASLQNDIATSAGKPIPFTQAQIDSIGGGSDWQSAALRSASTQSHQITVSGGDEKSKFYLSGNYFNQKGIIINTGIKRYSANISYERNVSSKFKVGVNIIASHSDMAGLGGTNVLGSTSAFTTALYTSPVAPIYNADGSYNYKNPYVTSTNGITPNAIADLNNTTNQTLVNRTLGNFYGEYKIIKDLALKVSFNGDIIDTKQNYYGNSFSAVGVASTGYASVGSEQVVKWLNENTLTYDHIFNSNHYLTVLAGYTSSSDQGQVAIANASNFFTDDISYNSLNFGTASKPSSYAYQEVVNSFLGRINYSYKHKYNLTASLRADGSSRFAEGKRWGYFPAIGLSWNINEENFAQNWGKTVNNLKLRVTAGSTGNQQITGFPNQLNNYYPTLPLLAPASYSFNNTLVNATSSTTLANPDLTWETTAQYNAGVDVGFFDGRINLSVDVYDKKTTNLLLNVPVPVSSGGQQSVLENLGSIQNQGIELGLNTDNLRGKALSWKTILVLATNQNKVLSLGGSKSFIPAFTNSILQVQAPLILQVGQPVGTFYGYKTNGIVQTTDNTATLPKVTWVGGGATPVPGDRKYIDQNHDGKIDANDKVILGSSQPKFTGGFTNTFNYKGFDLLVFFQGSYGGKLFNALKQQLDITTISTNADGDIADRWTPTNPSNTIPRASTSPTAVVSDRYIEDASYLRLKTLSLGYTLPFSVAKRILAKSLRVYVSAQNLVTWTKYTGYDPEANSFEQSTLYTGVDFGAYPSAKTYLVGLNVTF
jgi:TonB-linked SusC/RagA family outer membrane protein